MTDPLSTAAVAVGKDIATGASKGIIQTLNDIWYCAYGHKWDEKAQELRLRQTIKLDKLKKDLEQKIQVIPNENLQEPKLSVVGPALESAKFYMDENEIREMFANLIAASMNKSQADNIHPSFVEMIKMLSPLDAKNLYFLYSLQDETISKIRVEYENSGYNDIYNHIYLGNPECQDNQLMEPSIDNLIRLKLIDVSYDEYKKNDELYEKHRTNPLYLSYKEQEKEIEEQSRNILDFLNSGNSVVDSNTGNPLSDEIKNSIKKQLENNLKKKDIFVKKGKIQLTALGRNFCKVCL